jgi:hypothetical protein
MKTSLMASKPDYLICPLCEKGRLRPTGRGSMRDGLGRRDTTPTMLEEAASVLWSSVRKEGTS